MSVYKAKITPASPQFEKNRADMLALVAHLRALEARAVEASNKRRPTFEKRGQIVPQERIARLLDPGMPFLRLHTLANYMVDDPDPETSVPGASIIAGIGFVRGIRCMVWADDSGIRAGAMRKMSMPMAMSIQDICKRQKLPLIHLVESAGADLTKFTADSWMHAGEVFRNLGQMSAMGLPTLAVLHGPSTAGGAYMPGMSDYVIGIKDNGFAALAGAALVRAATGEVADDRDLGGTEMHANVSGVIEYLAEDDAHGLAMARDVMGRLNWNAGGGAAPAEPYDPPLRNPDELAGVIPADFRTPYDTRELLARIVDGSSFEAFKSRYGSATVCVQTSIMGQPCGVIGNNGPIDPAGATKAAQFIQLCDKSDLPIIFLHNTTGYMVGTESEQAGMIKHGSKMVQAVSNVSVPKIALYVGATFGAGNYGMCGMAYEPDFLFAWPNAKANVMGGEQAAKTMRQVAEIGAERKGVPVDEAALDAQTATIEAHFAREEDIFYGSGRLLDHGIIDPRDTRRVLGFVLQTCLEARARDLKPNSFGIARL